MSNAQKPTCFVIAPIGEKDSETRKHSDQALKYIFKKALSGDYNVIRADKISQPGMITSQILQAVQDSPLVLADLSEHNPNVFYELAVRHAAEKPIIHVIDVRWTIPFDVGPFRTIKFDLRDPDSIHNAVKELKEQAEQVRAGNWGETPVKLANIMRRANEDPPQMLLLKQVMQGIADISARLQNSYLNTYGALGAMVPFNTLSNPNSNLLVGWEKYYGSDASTTGNEPTPLPPELLKAQSKDARDTSHPVLKLKKRKMR